MSDVLEGLVLVLDDEHDGTATLSAAVHSEGFSGRGSASFGKRELLEFADAVEAFSFSLEGAPEIAGGYFRVDGTLDTILLGLRAILMDRLGHIAIRVEAAELPSANLPPPEERRVVAVVKTEAMAVTTFAQQLRELVEGVRHQVSLACA